MFWKGGKIRIAWIVTHVLAVAFGWTAVSFVTGKKLESTPRIAPPVLPQKTKSSVQRQQLDRSKPAGKLVWSLLEQIDSADAEDAALPAKDRAAAARTAIDEWVGDGRDRKLLSEAKIRFSHWLEADPKAALMYWNGSGSMGNPALSSLTELARPYLETTGLRELKDWIKEPDGLLTGAARDVVIDVFSKMIAANQDIGTLESELARNPAPNTSRVVTQAIMAWPKENLGSIEDFVRRNPSSQALQAFVNRLEAPDRIEWMRRELRAEGDLAKILRESGILAGMVYGATGASISARIGILDEMATGSPHSNISAVHMARGDLIRWLASADAETEGNVSDWKHRLRHGEIGARQVFDEARRALPTLAAEQPEEFRQTLLKQMAAIHPASAMVLISDLPLQQRESAMLDAAMGIAGQADPQKLFDLLSQMPPTLGSKPNDRFQVWIRAAAPYYDKFGESYSAWVAAMPHGIERDWALSGLYANFKSHDLEKAESYQALKTMPPGWRPAK